MKAVLPDEAATIALAEQLVEALPEDTSGLTLLLRGDLGAGKSTFARALIRGMGHTGTVPSPTYTLVEPYDLARGVAYHVDLYRVASEDELRYLGWTELDEGFRIVEWPDRAPGIAAGADLAVTLDYVDSGRRASIDALSDRGGKILGDLVSGTVSEPVD